MVVTKMDSVIGSGVGEVCQCLVEYKGAPCTKGGSTGVKRGIEGAKVRVRGTEVEIPSRATEN